MIRIHCYVKQDESEDDTMKQMMLLCRTYSRIPLIVLSLSLGFADRAWSLREQPVYRIAVLNFELNDLTLRPRTPQELARTASLSALLRDDLAQKGGYEVVAIPSEAQAAANAAFGYLFTHADEVARLARTFEAEWIVVGRLQKSNDLFAYLTVHLVDSRSAKLIGEFYTEVKGPITSTMLTRRGVARLRDQIDDAISAVYKHH